jgi:hypothetical protein
MTGKREKKEEGRGKREEGRKKLENILYRTAVIKQVLDWIF